jgi:hypothetical protein
MLRAVLVAIGVAAVAAGCGGSRTQCPSNGIIWLSWTVAGQTVSATVCQPIDHMSLEIHASCGSVVIEPIPCIRGQGWEYDGVPEGNAVIALDALDARGIVLAEATATVNLTTVRPPMTTAMDLR